MSRDSLSLEPPGALVLCLDAVTLASDSEGASHESAWSQAGSAFLAHARESGSRVAHAVSRRPTSGGSEWRPLPGLAPRPREPVYHRSEPSAFASEPLLALARQAERLEIIMFGVSVRASFLATAVDAAQLGVQVTVVSDASWIPESERRGLEGLLQLRRLGVAPIPLLRTSRANHLIGRAPLRVVEGGRR
jgi:hypothetical protein